MEMSGRVVPPREAGPRRYKALAPWRFQPGFVRQQVKHAAAAAPSSGRGVSGGVPEAKFCGSGAAPGGEKSGGVAGGEQQPEKCTRTATAESPDVVDGGRLRAGDGGDLGESSSCGVLDGSQFKGIGSSSGAGSGVADGQDCKSGRSNCNGSMRGIVGPESGVTGGGSGAGDGTACDHEEIGRNVGVEKCIPGGLEKPCVNGTGSKSNGTPASDCRSEGLKGNGGLGHSARHTVNECSTGDGAANVSGLGTKGCGSADHGSNGNGTYCRKGQKALAPWRFQVGYKRSFSKAFGSDSGSVGYPETPATRSTVRCYASAHPGVRVSAMRDFSVKGEESGTPYENRKTNNGDHNGNAICRERIMRSLQDFRLIYRVLLDKDAPKSDLQAYKIFRERFPMEFDDKKYVGSVPGIHVGDIFHLRVELCVVGLHRRHLIGVDYVKDDDETDVAISIVSYVQPSYVKNNLDVLVYSGSVAASGNRKIEGTNLALKKSMDTKTPIRVIHRCINHTNGLCRRKKLPTYIYGGLYLVEKYWRTKEREDHYVYKFRLRRMEGQKRIDVKEILKTGKAESYDCVIMKDISQGLERIPVSVVNSISDEYPMPYCYMSRLRYPRNYQPAPPKGCGCVGGCSDKKKCACTVKNGGEIPFNDKGLIVEAKPLIYECGPSCKCPPTCHNRVGQHGVKFRLQIFKTKSMGWGVRTLDFIPTGSFVCEYIGEVLEDEEAQRRTTDEYLFAIGHNYYDKSLWEGLSRSIPSLKKGPNKDDEPGFAVDASEMGNFAKFINHSCTPNLYAQNVLYDHDDISVPHIMFFACEDIRPHEELAYHYNYKIDQVHDANGNIKKKKCLCGSIECDGWLY
ncbi:hypothetical protein ACP70R_011224 [Stipagrostis hirtigluma subsp. patula]